MQSTAYDIRCIAEIVISEDRVPTNVLVQLIRDYGDDQHREFLEMVV